MTLTEHKAVAALLVHYGDRPGVGPVLLKLIEDLRRAYEMAEPLPRPPEENPYGRRT